MHFRSLLFAVPILFLSVVNTGAQYSASLPNRDVTVTSVNGVASFKGAPVAAEPGQPLLPVYTVTFLLPSNAEFSSVKVTLENLSEKELDGTFDVTPALPPTTRGEIVWPAGRNIVNGKDMDVYGRNIFFPAETKGNVHFGAMRNYKLAEVTVYPYRYNPVTRKLRVITGGTLVLSIPSPGGTQQQAPLMTTPESTVEKWLRSTVVNPQLLQGYGVQAPAGASQSLAAPAASGTYAIITTNAIVNGSTQLANLASLKRQKGFTVLTVTENTWGGGTGDLAANRIRSWLKGNYLTQNIRYVLLIGNPDPTLGDVPMKMCWPRLGSTSDAESPTDFFYAELSGNWDINNDSKFGDFQDFQTIGGPDQFAEVAVGRIPCYGSITTLDKILQKTIRYENETAVEWRRFAMIPMEPSDQGTPGYHVGEAIRTDYLVPGSMNSYRLYDAFASGAIVEDVLALNPPAESPECSETRVLNAWKNNDFGLVTWFTHGWSQGASAVFSSPNATYLDDQHPSITFQASCSNASPEDNANLAYSLLANGAVATIAATRVSWYLPGEQVYPASPSNPGMLHSFVQNVVRDSMEVAPALNFIKSMTIINDPCWWMNWLDYNVYGCPDVALSLKPSVVTAPTGLTATAVSSSQINITWTDRSSNETGFRIERAPYNGDFTQIATVGANATSYQNTGLSAGKQYQYRVRAYTSTENSLYSNVASTSTTGSTNNIPTGVTAQATDFGQMQVSFNPVTGATAYNVWISTNNGGTYALAFSELNGTTCYFDLAAGQTHYFVVSAITPDGESRYSAQVSGVAPLLTPNSLTAEAGTPTDVVLHWWYPAAQHSQVDGVMSEIEYATTGAFSLYGTYYCNIGENYFYPYGLTPGTTYQFRVRAVKDTLYSGYSNIATVTTLGPTDPCEGVQGGGNGLKGNVFGLNPPWSTGSEYCKATDGDINTVYDYSQANGGYTGLDLGSAMVISKIRYYPRATYPSRMVGGKFQGSNTSNSSGFVDLYTITATPAVQWNEVMISNPTAYRYVRYLSPDNGYGNIAEMEFYQGQSPFNDPHNIAFGATLQTEDFDNGGEGVAYHDNDVSNRGGAYRTGEGVDIENCSAGGYNIGYTNAGEWLEYTCNVTAGTYDIILYAASPNTGTQQVKLYQDNTLKATFTVPGTGGWQTYQAITVNGVSLAVNSASVLKIESTTGGYNLDKVLFSMPARFEAENAILSGGAKVNTNHAGYFGTGFVDGFFNSSSAQASFTVNVAAAGNYGIKLRYSAGNGTSSNTGLYVNGVMVKIISCPATANWDTWADESETVMLNAGNNTITYKAVTASTSCINLDRLTLGNTNLAFNKTASQSSTFNGCVASRAVDGNLNANSESVISHTNYDAQAWWQVDLGGVRTIDSVRVFNRTDCCQDRLSNWDLKISSDGSNWTTAVYTPGQCASPTVLNVNASGRYVRVQLRGTNYLHMGEVEVWGK